MTLLDECGIAPTSRPAPGTLEEVIFTQVLVQMTRAGKQVDFEGATVLSFEIQRRGHRSKEAVALARHLGLDPKRLPRRLGGG